MSLLAVVIAGFVTPSDLRANEIIATIPPLAGLVRMLDPQSDISCLLTAGSDPHHFQLSPRQVETVNRAALLVRSSKDDGSWMQLNPNIPVTNLWPTRKHAWLTPDAVRKALPRLAGRLIELSPEKRQVILERLHRAQATVDRIEKELKASMISLRSSGSIMQHPSWRESVEYFDIPVMLVLESSNHGHEHGPRHLEKALKILEEHPDITLIGDVRHSNRSLEWLANQSARKVLYLDALGNCGDSWEALMQNNIESILKR